MSLHGETKMPLFLIVIIVALFLLIALDIPRSVHVSSPPFPLYCPHTPFYRARVAGIIVVSTIPY